MYIYRLTRLDVIFLLKLLGVHLYTNVLSCVRPCHFPVGATIGSQAKLYFKRAHDMTRIRTSMVGCVFLLI
jgi:hypothetical protein